MRLACWVGAVALALLAAPASAQRLRIAVHPLAAPGVNDLELVKELDAETRDLLVGTGRITPVNLDDVAAQLLGDGGKCSPPADQQLKCLERLALTTRAEYALAVELKRLGASYVLSAVLVARNGAQVTQPPAAAITPPPGVKEQAVFKVELRRMLLEGMKLATIPAVPVQGAGDPPPPIAEKPAPPPSVETAPASKVRIVSYAAGGAGLLLGGVGAAFLVSASLAKGALNVDQRGNVGVPFSEDAAARALAANSASSAGAALVGVGGALLVTAAVVFLIAPAPDGPVQLSVVPFPNGGYVGMTMELP